MTPIQLWLSASASFLLLEEQLVPNAVNRKATAPSAPPMRYLLVTTCDLCQLDGSRRPPRTSKLEEVSKCLTLARRRRRRRWQRETPSQVVDYHLLFLVNPFPDLAFRSCEAFSGSLGPFLCRAPHTFLVLAVTIAGPLSG
jgi:hypothetical protein